MSPRRITDAISLVRSTVTRTVGRLRDSGREPTVFRVEEDGERVATGIEAYDMVVVVEDDGTVSFHSDKEDLSGEILYLDR